MAGALLHGKATKSPSLKRNHRHQETCWRKFILFRIAQPPARIQSPQSPQPKCQNFSLPCQIFICSVFQCLERCG